MRHQRLKSMMEKRKKDEDLRSYSFTDTPEKDPITKTTTTIYGFSLAADHDDMTPVEAQHIWKGFKEKTTAHGVAHVDQAKGVIKKGFWAAIFIAMIGGFVFNFYAITRTFTTYPVNVNIKMLHKSELTFPAVTICNMSPVKASALPSETRRKRSVQPTPSRKDAVDSNSKPRHRRATNLCPNSDWYEFLSNCYLPSTSKKTFSEAQMMCRSEKAVLTSIHDKAEQDFVQSITFDLSNKDHWLGLELESEPWTWTDGSLVVYTNWLKPPVSVNNRMCVRMSSEGVWLDMQCTSLYRFVCKLSDVVTSTTHDDSTYIPTAPNEYTSTTSSHTTVDASTLDAISTVSPSTLEPTTDSKPMSSERETNMTPTISDFVTTYTPSTLGIRSTDPTIQSTNQETTVLLTTDSSTTVIETTKVSTSVPESSSVEQSLAQDTTSGTTILLGLSTVSTRESTTTVETTPNGPTDHSTKEGITKASITHPTTNVVYTEHLSTTETTSTTNSTHTTASTEQSRYSTCCCTCCFDDSIRENCNSCTASSIIDAAKCARTVPSTSTYESNTYSTTLLSSVLSPPTPESEKPTVNGSSFPERIAVREDFKNEELFTEVLADIPLDTKKAFGFQVSDLILDCKYSGYECYPTDFTEFYNSIHGNCYIFNSGWNNTNTLLQSTKAGRRHGLHLIMNINQDEYVKQVGDTAGIRLVIHAQNRMPFPEDEGVTVSPGHSTSVGVRQLESVRKPHPYGNCSDVETSNITNNVYEELHGVQYSIVACQKTCYQRNVIKACGCGDPYYPMKGLAFGRLTVTACDSNNITQDDCRYLVNLKFRDNSLDCQCPPECRQSTYKLGSSFGIWPSKIQKDAILQKLSTKTGIQMNDPSFNYKTNLIKLEIHFEEFNFERISERTAYTVTSYLSDIGGILGLWIGFSLFTIIEFIELITDFFVLFCSRIHRNKTKNVEVEPVLAGPSRRDSIPRTLSQRQITREDIGVEMRNTPLAKRPASEISGTPPPPYSPPSSSSSFVTHSLTQLS